MTAASVVTTASTNAASAVAATGTAASAKPNPSQGKWDSLANLVSFGVCTYLTDREMAVSLNRLNKYWSRQNFPVWDATTSQFKPNAKKSDLQVVYRELHEQEKCNCAMTAWNGKYQKAKKDVEDKKAQLQKLEQSWTGYLASFSAVQNLFSGAQQTLGQVEQLKKDVADSESRCGAVLKEMPSLRFVAWENAPRILQNRKLAMHGRELCVNLFGGERFFQRLPVLNIGKRKLLENISVNEMTAPLMSGATLDGREFFAVVAEKNGVLSGTVFSQRFTIDSEFIDNARVLDAVELVTPSYGCFIQNGDIKYATNRGIYKAIKQLIETGAAEYEEPLLNAEPVKCKLTLPTRDEMCTQRKRHIRRKFQNLVINAVGDDLRERLRARLKILPLLEDEAG